MHPETMTHEQQWVVQGRCRMPKPGQTIRKTHFEPLLSENSWHSTHGHTWEYEVLAEVEVVNMAGEVRMRSPLRPIRVVCDEP